MRASDEQLLPIRDRVGILPPLAQTRGFRCASLLVNRTIGLECATTGWETRAAMEASRWAADDMRSRATTDVRGEIVEVHESHPAYAHLHVPEMA